MRLQQIIFCLCFLLATISYANVLDHVKPIENKTEGHSIQNIDFIYLINLDERKEKLKMTMDQLAPYHIVPFRFSGIYGWRELTLEKINDIGVKYRRGMDCGFQATTYLPNGDKKPYHELISYEGRAYFCHCLSLGAIGCLMSHLSILKDAYESGYETIWVLEDDIEIIRDPHLISDRIEELDQVVGKDGWDILFTDRDIRNAQGYYICASGYARRPNYTPSNMERTRINQKISKNLRALGARFGSASMVVRRSGMKKLLHFFGKYDVYHPYDMDYHAPEGMRLFTVLEDIVTNKTDAISDNGVYFFE